MCLNTMIINKNDLDRRAVIITAYISSLPEYKKQAGDYVICADGGYTHAINYYVEPDIVIGDCDSVDKNAIPERLLELVPKEKDDTDTMLCVKHAVSLNYKRMLIIGGIGGRLDHTIANIQSLAFALSHNIEAIMMDNEVSLHLVQNGSAEFDIENGTLLSVFAYSSACTGVYESGVKYPLNDAKLTNSFPLGVSNEIIEKNATVSVSNGTLLIIQQKV